MSEQGRRPDQVASNERISAFVLLGGLAGIVIGVIWQALRCGS